MEWVSFCPVACHQRSGHDADRGAYLVRRRVLTESSSDTELSAWNRFSQRELRASDLSSRFRYTKVLLLIIESAMIYSAALVIEITLYFIGSNAFYIVYDPIAQLTVSISLNVTSGMNTQVEQ